MNILYLCTANSARSIMAEALTNHLARISHPGHGLRRAQGEKCGLTAGRLHGWSAGSYPRGSVNPFAVELLKSEGMWSERLRSKSWDEFARERAPEMHAVITVCDQAAVCPAWPGHPATAHWGLPDPAIEGPEEDVRAAFRLAFLRLRGRISKMLDLPLETLDRDALAAALAAIQAEAVDW